MATGTYGTIRPADVSPTDVDIILNYTQSRDVTNDFQLTKLNSSAVLTPYFHNTNTGGNADIEILGGLYNLRLPANVFNQLGIYTLYIRPAEIRTTITDCGILASLPNIKGIVVDLNNVPVAFRDKFVNQGLIGYRVEYLQPNGAKIPNFFRIITSSFYCEPVVQNSTNTTTSIVRYQYVNGVTNLMFCTLSPSSSPSNKPNATPFIGQPDQDIIISNTFFNPVTMEIEIVEHDISTLAIALFGNQTKSLNDGIYTLYDTQNNIYKQYNLFEIRDQYNELLYEVREDRGNNIDFSKNFSNITQ